MNKLDEIVKTMLETHEGGEVFFDNLDHAIRINLPIVDELLNKIPDFKNKHIIVSGKFGIFFKKYLDLLDIAPKSLTVVRGGLRKGKKIIELNENTPSNSELIFIDDSFYSGTTRKRIEEKLNTINSTIKLTYVVYDGSIVKSNNVKSLYRYYK